jgi:hypothetical protein
MNTKGILVCVCLTVTLCAFGCQKANQTSQSQTANTNQGVAPQQPGVEKAKPAPGTGNVQGKVLYNGKPVEGIEVKLCETFSRFLGGCGGKIFAAQTDRDGDYVIANVEPKVYEGLIAKVFNTDSYVFATSGIGGLSSTKYEVTADKTLFVSPTNLFKSDLKITNPKAGAKVSTNNLELKWDAYPDAAYYKFSIYPEDSSTTSPYINERTDSPSFSISKPLQKGTYRWQVEAYNGSDQKLSESADDIKFTITDGAGG